ncbi:RsmE family RNA methyltransferase [Armatimonas sp.]|uniref:RsmE family RNA methyltransferase n=1 Tax=Armatimonas sp. TaxID=1872638 RepID=UPI00286AF21C|nr:RsmE family RNA methyltransferase [Armatimonas sp.]
MPQCFFIEPTVGELQYLPDDKTHHVVNVLKMHRNETVRLHDGQGRWALATLEILGKRKVSARLTSAWEPVNTEPERRVTVFQAFPKTGDKVEQVLQHGTELGAVGFVLFPSERAQARMEDRDRITRKVERWEELIRNAAEQSGRGILPSITYVRSFEEALTLAKGALVLLDEDAANPPLSGTGGQDLGIFVGSESGFTALEKKAILGAGATAASLGPRTLRTETAALAALAKLL